MADRIWLPVALDANGDTIAGAQALFYAKETSTPIVVYSDEAGTTPVSQPLAASSAGVFAPTYTNEATRIDIQTPEGVPIPGYPQEGFVVYDEISSASGVIFNPITGNAAINVQAAIAANVSSINTLETDLDAAEVVIAGLGTTSTLDTQTAVTDVDTEIPTGGAVVDYIPAIFNATGSAPFFACRAWVNFDASSTIVIRGSGNVASITDSGTGLGTVNFTTDLPDANYCVVAGGKPQDSNNAQAQAPVMTFDYTTSGFSFRTNSASATANDWDIINMAVFR